MPILLLSASWALAAVQMVQAVANNAFGVSICIVSDAFNMPLLFQNNVYQNNWALRKLAKWCATAKKLSTCKLRSCRVQPTTLLLVCCTPARG